MSEIEDRQQRDLPIYRAKKRDSETYVEGHLLGEETIGTLNFAGHVPEEILLDTYTVDMSTLAIHFQGMISSQGTKIFASLGEYGGDIVVEAEDETNGGTMVFFDRYLQPMSYLGNYDYSFFKVVGIQKKGMV